MLDKLRKRLADMRESTRRAWRTARQALLATGAALVAVAIEPVRGAVNAALGLLPWDVPEVSPGLIAAIGLLGSALIALVTKVDNLVEGRDQMLTVNDVAAAVMELTELTEALANAAAAAGVEVREILDGFNVGYSMPDPPGADSGPEDGSATE